MYYFPRIISRENIKVLCDVKMSTNDKPAKIDYAYLLEKYGKNHKPKHKPKYYENGFSIQFQLSHAFYALDKQEQEASKVPIAPKVRLNKRIVQKLLTEAAKLDKDEDNKQKQVIVNRGIIADRVTADLEKYRQLGKKKQEKVQIQEAKHRYQRQREENQIGSLHSTKPKVRSEKFWRNLMNGKSVADLEETKTENDKTFITNFDPEVIINTKKTVSMRHRSRSKSPSRSTKNKHIVRAPVNAVVEWQKRRMKRRQVKTEQAIKIKHATQNIRQENIQTAALTSPIANTPIHKDVNRPSSALTSKKNHQSQSSSQTKDIRDLPTSPSPDNTAVSRGKSEKSSVKRIRISRSLSEKLANGESGESGENKNLSYRPVKYLFNMCNCKEISKPQILRHLQKTKKVGGVIEMYACSGKESENECQYCALRPRRRIQAWIEDVEIQTGAQDLNDDIDNSSLLTL